MKYVHEFQNTECSWFAVDKDGNGFEFTEEPVVNGNVWHIHDYVFNGAKAVEHAYTGNWEGSLQQDGIAIDELKGCKITQRKEQDSEVGGTLDRLMTILNDDLDMQKIALEACLKQQKAIHRAKAKAVIGAGMKVIGLKDMICLEHTVVRKLYDAGMLSMPEGDNND